MAAAPEPKPCNANFTVHKKYNELLTLFITTAIINDKFRIEKK